MLKKVSNSDVIYVDCSIPTPEDLGNQAVPATYNVTYDQAILDNPRDYFMAVVKFSIPLQNVPLIIFPVNPNSGFTQVSPIEVGVSTTASPYTQFVENLIWVPRNLLPQPVNQNNPNKQIVTDYYYLFDYDHFADLVTTALVTAWTNAGSPGGAIAEPYFFWDSDSNKFKWGTTIDFPDAGYTIIYNQNFKSLVKGFHDIFDEGYYRLVITPSPGLVPSGKGIPQNTGTPAAPAGPAWDSRLFYPLNTIFISPSYVPLDYFNSLRRIVITSNSLPAQKEYFPVAGERQTGIPNTLGVISDFQVDIQNFPGAQTGIALFDAEIYRLIDLVSDHPMRKIDLALFWLDRFNNLYPIFLTVGESINIKLGFFNKELFKDQHMLKH